MVEHNRAFYNNSAEIFAEAVERFQAGEPLEVVLAAYPPEYRANLHSLLAVVAKAQEIQQAPVPLPAPSRRAAHREAFLRAVAVEERRSFWTALRDAFTVRPLRLAPLALMCTLLLLASTTVVTLAQESVPGDRVYPIKQWIRQQKLYLSPPEQRAIVRSEQEEELVQDVRKVTTRPDLRGTAIEAEEIMLFHSYGAGYLNIGGLRVLPQYEPDPNQSNTRPMEIVGALAPGKIVSLRYRLLPGQAGSDVPMVQGISLQVIEQQPPEPTPLPTATPTIPPGCSVTVRSGWLPYKVQAGDSLASLAYRRGASLEELRLVNCLASDEVAEGALVLLPPARNQPESTASPEAPVVSTPVDTATPDLVDTATLLPAPTEVLTATAPSPATVTPEATATPSVVFTATVIMPLETTLATATPDAGPPVTTTLEATPADTVEPGEPATPATVWPTVTPTAEKTETVTPEATLTAEATPETPAAPPTTVMTATVAPVDTPAPGEPPGAETATAAASPTPTGETIPGATPEMTDTPTTQATDSPTASEPSNPATPEASITAQATPVPTEAEATPTATSEAPPTSTSAPPQPTEPPPTATSAPPPPIEPPSEATSAPPPPPGPPPEVTSAPPSGEGGMEEGGAPADATDGNNSDS